MRWVDWYVYGAEGKRLLELSDDDEDPEDDAESSALSRSAVGAR